MDNCFHALLSKEVVLNEGETSMLELQRRDAALDEALRCTFPASDPIALSFSFDVPGRPGCGQRWFGAEFIKPPDPGQPS
ncbi:hypothetical protein [Noviherbaspirillum galbum]|uniref:Uncharacterized protein n=1 Tax=Noviherbaspirillum galbum TaxID=2709383 RepID=A0A6B3SVU2_9BURK|nr:hypothetical protein [Noviherbaspirillum galbum]NEX64648.1 hypothetical protein [Noviherbaspirillum galbum]